MSGADLCFGSTAVPPAIPARRDCHIGAERRLFPLPSLNVAHRESDVVVTARATNRRLLEPIENIPSVEYEEEYYRIQEAPTMLAGLT